MQPRKLIKQSFVKTTYLGYSLRMQRTMYLDSELEVDYFNYLDFDNSILEFDFQPFPIPVQVGDRVNRYTPDFFVIQKSGEAYLDEVKPYKRTQSEDFKRETRRRTRLLADMGYEYRVLTEHDIRVGNRAENLVILRPALFLPPPKKEFREFNNSFSSLTTPLAELQSKLVARGFDGSFLMRAIAHRLIDCDLTQPWDQLQLSW